MLETAINLLVVETLPDDFWHQLSQWSANPPDRYTVGLNAAVTFVRHNFSNYDGLLAKLPLTDQEIDMLRVEVNIRATIAVQERIKRDARYK